MTEGLEFGHVKNIDNSIHIKSFLIYVFKYDVSFELDIKLLYVSQIEYNKSKYIIVHFFSIESHIHCCF